MAKAAARPVPTVKMEGPGGQITVNADDEANLKKYSELGYEIVKGTATVDVEDEEDEEDANLNSMKKAELVELAVERGIDPTGMKKVEIIEALS